jgi:hypothetical protein
MDTREELTRLIREYERGSITLVELEIHVLAYLGQFPQRQNEVLSALSTHPDESVREVARWVRDDLRKRQEQIKDIDQVRRTSPLKPGTRLTLGGGYTEAYHTPRWLNGRDCYQATFLGFAERGTGKMPVALVQLDDEIELPEGKGRFALLKLLYVANWADTGTVTVHIVEALPEDLEAFYASHPLGTEVESHATYRIAADDHAG